MGDIFVSTNEGDTEKRGKILGREIVKQENPRVVLLSGVLGSGKSVFVRGIARVLGIESRILSPTFLLLRRYSCPDFPSFTFHHYDLYRLNGKKEAEGIGLAEVLKDPDVIVAIEWPESLGMISVPHYCVTISGIDEDSRIIRIEKREEVPEALSF
jgi:tRNA threonylcarbamoyladenosine biosynthesis protein TsaE